MDFFFSLLRASLGILVLLGIAYLFSKNRKAINWRIIVSGVLLQIILGLLILKVPGFKDAFEVLSNFFVKLLDFTEAGTDFVFGNWPDLVKVQDIAGKPVLVGYLFVIKALPTIIFFSALTSGLYYLGILQKVVYAFAWIMHKLMKLSGSESLAVAANVFLGQTEAPLLVKPYVPKMTRSELMALMTGGMATIAGGVLAAFVGMLGGEDPQAREFIAKHLLSASIMSAPAAIVAAKLLVPEINPDEVSEDMKISNEKIGVNLIDALSDGASQGLKLAANVAGMLIAFIAVVAMVNYFLKDILGETLSLNAWVQEITDGKFNGFSLQFIFGVLFSPLTYLMGVDTQDILLVSSLLGEKTVINEFVAYTSLASLPQGALSQKSYVIAAYALCGFSNFSSIAIQIGGIGGLAPNRRGDLSQLGLIALLGGTIACLMTATIAGIII